MRKERNEDMRNRTSVKWVVVDRFYDDMVCVRYSVPTSFLISSILVS